MTLATQEMLNIVGEVFRGRISVLGQVGHRFQTDTFELSGDARIDLSRRTSIRGLDLF